MAVSMLICFAKSLGFMAAGADPAAAVLHSRAWLDLHRLGSFHQLK